MCRILYSFIECHPKYFGMDCNELCSGHCINNKPCHHINGECTNGCTDGYIGSLCTAGKTYLFLATKGQHISNYKNVFVW